MEGPGPCGLQVGKGVGQGPQGFLILPCKGEERQGAGLPSEVLSLDCPTFLLVCGGGRGVGRDRSPWLSVGLFIWGNVWYVWYLGVYFPGCSWVPGVEIWLFLAVGEGPSGPGQGSYFKPAYQQLTHALKHLHTAPHLVQVSFYAEFCPRVLRLGVPWTALSLPSCLT